MRILLRRLKRTLVLAEIGMNHDGSIGQAMAIIRAAAESGADAVKLQAHIAEAETLRRAQAPPYFNTEPRFEYFKRTAFSVGQYRRLRKFARSLKMGFIVSPFSEPALDLLLEAGVDALKVPSGEVTNLPLLRKMGASGLPVLLSSGMSSLTELDQAVPALRRSKGGVGLLQCTSMYPCPYENVGLNLIGDLRRRYRCPVGLSDHTTTIYASLAAVVAGARIIERHFTLSKKMYGPDARFSLDPREFREMTEGIRAVETMLAHPVDKNGMCRRLGGMKRVFEKSVVSVRAIRRGQIILARDVALKKPGGGIPPKNLAKVLGALARVDIPEDRKILPGMLSRSR